MIDIDIAIDIQRHRTSGKWITRDR